MNKKLLTLIIIAIFILSIGCTAKPEVIETATSNTTKSINTTLSSITTSNVSTSIVSSSTSLASSITTMATTTLPITTTLTTTKIVINPDEQGYLFTTGRVSMYDNYVGNSNILITLDIGTKVYLIETMKNSSNAIVAYKLLYRDYKGDEITGYISSIYLSTTLNEVLGEKYSAISYASNPKPIFESNPHIDVKGVYVSRNVAGYRPKLDNLIELTKTSDINAFVIDVKGDRGYLTWNMEVGDIYTDTANDGNTVGNIDALVKELKADGIYLIARIVCFKDTQYSTSHPDRAIRYIDSGEPFIYSDGTTWASPHDRELWDYNIEIAKNAIEAGFNEVQFDYVRFPETSQTKNIDNIDFRTDTGESKPEAIAGFLSKAKIAINDLQAYLSADVFGLVGTASNDLLIGQHWESVVNYVDFISPMMYPSHYAKTTYGIPLPDAAPYDTIYYCTIDSLNRNLNIDVPGLIRPWIQDFTAPWITGHIEYNEEEVRAQIRALSDLGINSYLLWNASNVYTEEAVTN